MNKMVTGVSAQDDSTAVYFRCNAMKIEQSDSGSQFSYLENIMIMRVTIISCHDMMEWNER